MISGGVAFLALPPADLGPASFGALIPLLLALRGARGRAGFVLGVAFGLAYLGPLLWWVSLFGYLGWSVLVVSQALFFGLFGWFAAWASREAPGRILGVPLIFTAAEILRTRWPLGGFAWGDLGYAQHDAGPLLALARVGGVHLITLALVAINALAALALTAGRVWRRALGVLIAGGIAAGPVWLPLGLAGPRAGELDVALVQGNVPEGTFTGFAERVGRRGPEDLAIVQNHVRATEPLATSPPDLIVWPENAIDRDPFTNPETGLPVADVVRRVGAPLIAGAILDAPDGRFRNANLLYDTTGEVVARYEKLHLVPFGEYVPWPRLRRYIKDLEQIPSDGIAGARPVTFDLGQATVGSVICFESTYPQLVRSFVREGAQLLVVTTNNASFRRSPASRQHVAMSQLRAVEEGRAVLHTAISGISAVIDPRGGILAATRLFTPAVLRRTVSLAGGLTPYGRWGPEIEYGMATLGGLASLMAFGRLLTKRRSRRFADAEVEMWGGEDTLQRAITEREVADREIAERAASRLQDLHVDEEGPGTPDEGPVGPPEEDPRP